MCGWDCAIFLHNTHSTTASVARCPGLSRRCLTTWHHRICQVIASSLIPLGTISFDHQTFQVHYHLTVHVLEIGCRTTPLEQSCYTVSINLIGPCTPSAAFNCSRHQRLATVVCRHCVQIFLLTYLYSLFNRRSLIQLLHDGLGSQKTTYGHNCSRFSQAGCHFVAQPTASK